MQEPKFVGCRVGELLDGERKFPLSVFYPTLTPSKKSRVGPHLYSVATDAPPDGRHPLVLLSHGSGGMLLIYRALVFYLVRQGFVVAVPEHPGNNYRDNSLEGTVENLTGRPRHLRAALDCLFDQKTFGGVIAPGPAAVIGHSMGGYTALAVAGGVPTTSPGEAPDDGVLTIPQTRDPRVGALVLLAPATLRYRNPGALRAVNVPIFMVFGDRDTITPPESNAPVVLKGVPDPDRVRCRLVKNAGHFSFLDPCPRFPRNSPFFSAQDLPDFNRKAFLQSLHAEILDFLTGTTAAGRCII
ncbi:MAG: alpha/beta hydrolase [Synergistaceae bacterium]|nr:alpha/beta hydrolase [Synergistaceae bacterium]